MSVRKPQDLARAKLTPFSEVRARGGALFWSEREGGKSRLAGWADAPRRHAADHALTPGVGYGGGAFGLGAEAVYYVAEGRVWRLPFGEDEAQPLTPAFGAAADPQPNPDGSRVVYVHSYEGRDVLAVASAAGGTWPEVWAQGADFYM